MTTSTPAMDILDRLHGALVRALGEDRRDAFGAPVTVAEIYQDLVPYRLIRVDLGFEMNADYEHTVLRLLSGERGLAELEPAEARKELQQELDSPNPNVGLFRKFAGCDVHLRPGRMQEEGDAAAAPVTPADEAVAAVEPVQEKAAQPVPTSEPEAVEAPVSEAAPAGGTGGNGRGGVRQAEAPAQRTAPRADAGSVAAESASEAGACPFCDEDLPPGRAVRFCPYCGADQSQRPCLACGETLEHGWRFCITCGTEAPAPSA